MSIRPETLLSHVQVQPDQLQPPIAAPHQSMGHLQQQQQQQPSHHQSHQPHQGNQGQGNQGGQGGNQGQRQPLRWPSEFVQWAAQRREVQVHLAHCPTTEMGFLAEVHRTHLTLVSKQGKKSIILADHVALVKEI